MGLFEGDRLTDYEKEELMKKYPSLTDKDFDEDDNKKLLMHLQKKLGKTKDEMREILRNI